MDDMEALLRLGRRLEQRPSDVFEAAQCLLRVRDRQGRLRPLKANAAQRSFEARRGRQNVVLKARQMGMSTWVAGRFFLRTITRPGTLTLQVAHTREASEALLSTVRRMWEELPESLREGPLRLGRVNAGQMTFSRLDSEIRVASAADTNAGRGLSVQQLHCSEVSRWPGDAMATLSGLRAALAPDGELVLESTPNGAHGAFYGAWQAALDERRACDDDEMIRHFLPWWMEPGYVGPSVQRAEMNAEETSLTERHGLSAAQIGFRRGLEKSYGGLRSQEFAEDAETCFRTTGTCCFELEALERRLMEVPEPVSRRRNGALRIWLPPVRGRQYLLAVDTAAGRADGDFAAAQVVELGTGLQCAELQERLRPAELARVCVELARDYCEALMVVERNNHGAAVLAFLETEQRYEKIYRGHDGQAGWLTSAVSKPEIVARLGTLLAGSPERFMSRWLLSECRSFVSDERGRASAAGGSHDDLVMSMAIAQAVRAELLVRMWRA